MEPEQRTSLQAFNKSCLSVLVCGLLAFSLLAAHDPMARVMGYGFVGFAAISSIAAARSFVREADIRRRLHVFRTQGAGLHVARWASEEEMEAAGMFDGVGRPLGLTFTGRALFEPHRLRPVHSKVIATSGAGKTIGAVVTAIMHQALSPDRPSMVIFDIKGELAGQCANALRRAGIEVAVIDDTGLLRLQPETRLNPFGLIVVAAAQDSPELPSLVRLVALTLEPEPEGDARNKYFRDGPRDLLRFVIEYLARFCTEECTPSAAGHVLGSDDLLEAAFDAVADHDSALGQLARRLMEKRSENPQHFSDFRTTALQRLEVYEEGGLLWEAGSEPTLRHEEIRARQIVVFLVAGLQHLRDTRAHYILHLAAFLHAAKRPGHRVEFIIDEFTNAPVAGLVEDLTIVRQFGSRVLMVAQAESEIERQFSDKAARTIDALTAIKQVMGVSTFDEGKRVSDALGRTHHVVASYGHNGREEQLSTSFSDQGRPLMSPEEVLALPRHEQIIFCDGLKPIRARKLYQNEVAPICDMLDANPLEAASLPPAPIVHITYGEPS
ncbi:MAG TPA: type IV secretory system conjugative DNA transfer family protein [Hyphomicrobium sp.]|mgnify:CR=1 FL=1|nr:type IV secretory system conjugative DNA transfer family protein [Hyphomicrobium sp.]